MLSRLALGVVRAATRPPPNPLSSTSLAGTLSSCTTGLDYLLTTVDLQHIQGFLADNVGIEWTCILLLSNCVPMKQRLLLHCPHR